MLDTYRLTVAGALSSAWASTKATRVSGEAGKDTWPCSAHQDAKTAVSERTARSVLGE